MAYLIANIPPRNGSVRIRIGGVHRRLQNSTMMKNHKATIDFYYI
jgi:hypothetical protein